jgi:hypothetical protein
VSAMSVDKDWIQFRVGGYEHGMRGKRKRSEENHG